MTHRYYTPNILLFISDTFFNSPSICYVSGLLSPSLSWGWELSHTHTHKRQFWGPQCLRAVIGWCMRRGIVGRHDKQGEAISGTSKARGMKALWHPEPLSNNWLSDRADLGLNHYQKKRAPLDRKMERRWECICVCVREREREKD